MSPEQLHAVVAASRAAQGLPPVIEDPATLERVAAVFRLPTAANAEQQADEPKDAGMSPPTEPAPVIVHREGAT